MTDHENAASRAAADFLLNDPVEAARDELVALFTGDGALTEEELKRAKALRGVIRGESAKTGDAPAEPRTRKRESISGPKDANGPGAKPKNATDVQAKLLTGRWPNA